MIYFPGLFYTPGFSQVTFFLSPGLGFPILRKFPKVKAVRAYGSFCGMDFNPFFTRIGSSTDFNLGPYHGGHSKGCVRFLKTICVPKRQPFGVSLQLAPL